MIKVYGINNCDTVKKAIHWLKENQIEFEFHDYKKRGISAEKIDEWLSQYPFEKLVNKAGTTYKKLSDSEKALIIDNQSAKLLMLEKNSVIKRPIIESDKILLIGFNVDSYASVLGKKAK